MKSDEQDEKKTNRLLNNDVTLKVLEISKILLKSNSKQASMSQPRYTFSNKDFSIEGELEGGCDDDANLKVFLINR